MPGTPEDERSAATIYTSLSSYVITASLGVIAAQAALATFVLDKRDHLTWFYMWLIAGLIASVASIVLGGKGIAGIASAGFAGSWTLRPRRGYFNYQALLCLLGIAFLLFSLFCGTTKNENPKATEEIQRLNVLVVKLEANVDGLRTQCARLSEEIKSTRKCSSNRSRARK